MSASLTESKILAFKKKVEKEKRTQYLTDSTGMALFFRYGTKGVTVTYLFRNRKAQSNNRIKIGTFPAMDLATARQKFMQMLSNQERGMPIVEPDIITFEKLWEDFLATKCRTYAPRTIKRYLSIYRTHFEKFKNYDIKKFDMAFVKSSIVDPLTAEKKISILHSIGGILYRMFNYAKHLGYFPFNPLQDLHEILPEHKVKHHPSFKPDEFENELPKLFDTFAQNAELKVQALLHLYFYTLLRNEELRKLKISELKDYYYTLETKTWKEVEFRVCFSTQAQELIKWLIDHHVDPDNPYLFEGRQSAMMSENTLNDNLKKYGYKGKLVCHGIRGIGEKWITAQPEIKEMIAKLCIGHKTALGNQSDQTYNEGDYFDLRQTAMQKWSDFVESCIGKNRFY